MKHLTQIYELRSTKEKVDKKLEASTFGDLKVGDTIYYMSGDGSEEIYTVSIIHKRKISEFEAISTNLNHKKNKVQIDTTLTVEGKEGFKFTLLVGSQYSWMFAKGEWYWAANENALIEMKIVDKKIK